MTTRLCFASACHFTPWKSSKYTSFEMCKPGGRHTAVRSTSLLHGSSSLSFSHRAIKSTKKLDAGCVTKVAAAMSVNVGVDEIQVHELFGAAENASVDECSSSRGRGSAESVTNLSGYLKNIEQRTEDTSGGVKEGTGEGLVKASEETSRQVRIQDLRIGCIYKGKVSIIESYGVFVDIGAHIDGFVHISRLGRSFVRRVEDVVQLGQDVTVQIVDVDLHANSISLLLGPEEGFTENVSLRCLTLSEHEVVNRAAARRANKLARRAENPSPRRGTSLETRQRLKAYRRAVLAERQAIQLHQARSRARNSNAPESLSYTHEADQVIKQSAVDENQSDGKESNQHTLVV
eukprot:c18497_g1_i1 orf=342-1382(-)